MRVAERCVSSLDCCLLSWAIFNGNLPASSLSVFGHCLPISSLSWGAGDFFPPSQSHLGWSIGLPSGKEDPVQDLNVIFLVLMDYPIQCAIAFAVSSFHWPPHCWFGSAQSQVNAGFDNEISSSTLPRGQKFTQDVPKILIKFVLPIRGSQKGIQVTFNILCSWTASREHLIFYPSLYPWWLHCDDF